MTIYFFYTLFESNGIITPVRKVVDGEPKDNYSQGCYKPISHARLVNI